MHAVVIVFLDTTGSALRNQIRFDGFEPLSLKESFLAVDRILLVRSTLWRGRDFAAGKELRAVFKVHQIVVIPLPTPDKSVLLKDPNNLPGVGQTAFHVSEAILITFPLPVGTQG